MTDIDDISLQRISLFEMTNADDIESHYDKQVNSIYHAMEFGKISATQMSKLAWKLRGVLKARRKFKTFKALTQSKFNPHTLYDHREKLEVIYPAMAEEYIKTL